MTIFREALDDIRRHRRDKEVNSQKYRRVVRGKDTSELVPSSKLRVGDLVSIYELGNLSCDAECGVWVQLKVKCYENREVVSDTSLICSLCMNTHCSCGSSDSWEN